MPNMNKSLTHEYQEKAGLICLFKNSFLPASGVHFFFLGSDYYLYTMY